MMSMGICHKCKHDVKDHIEIPPPAEIEDLLANLRVYDCKICECKTLGELRQV